MMSHGPCPTSFVWHTWRIIVSKTMQIYLLLEMLLRAVSLLIHEYALDCIAKQALQLSFH